MCVCQGGEFGGIIVPLQSHYIGVFVHLCCVIPRPSQEDESEPGECTGAG